jgi:hypothetical protein
VHPRTGQLKHFLEIAPLLKLPFERVSIPMYPPPSQGAENCSRDRTLGLTGTLEAELIVPTGGMLVFAPELIFIFPALIFIFPTLSRDEIENN